MPFQLRQRLYNRLRSMQNLNPARIVVTSFAIVILTGALLLMLPIASRDGQVTPFLTCLFTATSSTCVTGLIMVDTWVRSGGHYSDDPAGRPGLYDRHHPGLLRPPAEDRPL